MQRKCATMARFRCRASHILFVAAIVLAVPTPAQARPPQKVGECAVTTIKEIGDRFGDPLPASTPNPGTCAAGPDGAGQVRACRMRGGNSVRCCGSIY
jgi:hypothetical protein